MLQALEIQPDAGVQPGIQYSLRPLVYELPDFQFRGYVDVTMRHGRSVGSFLRYCPLIRGNRDEADLDAMRLVQALQRTECGDGRCWVISVHDDDAAQPASGRAADLRAPVAQAAGRLMAAPGLARASGA